MNFELLKNYFPEFDREQTDKLLLFEQLIIEWNKKINIISRKDIDNLFVHHILHSLALYKFVRFGKGMTILDVGTGGGFPGIPLAIAIPYSKFTLIDGRSKKILVLEDIADKLKLNNIIVKKIRSEEFHVKFDAVTGRAVTSLQDFAVSASKNLKKGKYPESGIYYWSGEQKYDYINKIYKIENIFKEEYFKNKFIYYLKKQFPILPKQKVKL